MVKNIRFLPVLLLLLTISGNSFAKSYKDYITEGNNFYKKKAFVRAAESYEQAAKVADGNVNVFYNLGLTYQYIKNYPKAILNLEKFLSLDTGSKRRKMIKNAKNLVARMSVKMAKPTTAGKLKHYEVWEGWILIDSDVIVPKDIELTIKPGTLVMFTPLSSRYDAKIPYLDKDDTDNFPSLIIRGRLIARGEKENEILFANSFEDLSTKKTGLWGGIIFERSNYSVLQYARIERANNGVVFKDSSNIRFSHNVFMKNEVSVKMIDKSPIALDNSIYYRNETGVEYSENSNAMTTSSNFTKNNYAIKVTGNAKPRISNNTFNGNNCGVCTFKNAFPSLYDNKFENSKFGISMTGNSRAFIKENSFSKNKIGVNAVNNAFPDINYNEFTENTISAINAADNSSAQVNSNKFIKNKVAVTKVEAVELRGNEFKDNEEDVKDID